MTARGARALPAGTVTFLFTDVEGSTRLWERFGDAMGVAQEHHDAIVRDAVVAAGGHVVKTMGDGVMAAFTVVDDAMTAAIESQRAIGAADWAPIPALRVRMGIHTGPAEPAHDDYLGPAVNRAARVADAAHGGQIIASGASAALSSPPPGVQLRSMGRHRLRDLSEPVELFQVEAGGLPTPVTAPLRTLDAADHNIPAPRTSFIGREAEIGQVAEAVRTARLVTLTGMGGAGKTRLALRVGAEVAVGLDRVRLIELSAHGDRGALASALATGLGTPPGSGPVAQRIASHIGSMRVLVVLDNCEHLLEAAAELIDELLSACPGLQVLATSQQPLGVSGERVHVVRPLPLDDPTDAVALFVDRAREARADFVLDEASRPWVERICRCVDGIPLAIELAAARISHLIPSDIASRLEEHLDLLVSRNRAAPDRQRTIAGAFEWSHDLLEPREQVLLRRMAVFETPVPLTALEQVCADGALPRPDVLERTATLVDRSFLATAGDAGESRFGMLATVRRHAQGKLDQAGETEAIRRRHATWATGLVAGGSFPDLDTNERSEVRAALQWSMGAGETALAIALAGGSWQAWELSGHPEEGRALLDRVLKQAEETGHDPSPVLVGLANLAFAARDYAAARAHHEQNLGMLRRGGDARDVGSCLNALAMACLFDGDPVAADAAATEALACFDSVDDDVGRAYAHSGLAMFARARDDVDGARDHLVTSLNLLRAAGRRREAASVLTNLGNLASDAADTARAHRFYEGALQLQREVGDDRGAALSLNNMSIVARERGDFERATDVAVQALELFRQVGDRPGEAATLNNLGSLAREQGQAPRALDLYQQAADAFRLLRDVAGLETTRANIADLMVELDTAAAEAAEPVREAPLTKREQQITAMVARGLTNKEIAAQLFVSVRTVDTHITNARGKLGIDSRTKLTRWALEHHLA